MDLADVAQKGQQPQQITEDMFECSLCQCIFLDPVTTACGHTYCRECIVRAMDHDNRCPFCRTIIHITPNSNVSVLIQNLIQQLFPTQYETRRQERAKELQEQHFNLPLFLLGELTLFPGGALPLHVFEPRYRLMVRRCLEGGRRFGVVPILNGDLSSVGCAAILDNHYVFPDGRSLITTTGGQRFKILSIGDQDAYKVAKVEYFDDDPVPEESTGRIQAKFCKAKELVLAKFATALPQIEEKLGRMPENATNFGWWLSSVLPVSTEEKYNLLISKSPEDRLDTLLKLLNSESTSTCAIS